MPITLNHSNISVQYSRDKSYIIETVKSDLYVGIPTAMTTNTEPTYTPQAFTTERMYPPVRNFTQATTTLSGQVYGNGTYVVSYSSFLSPYEPFKCFNTSDITGGHWMANYSNGNYNGSASIVDGYLGDWLKIQLPIAIKLTRFSFLQRTSNVSRAPKDFKIYGSNDNITWVELVNKTNAVYNASYMYEQTTPEITNTYTYYGLVVNKLLAGQYNDTLNFDEWYIYGQETIVAIAEGNPITHKTLNFAYVPQLLIYNFTPYNDLASWTAYATSFGATTLFNYFDSTGAWHVPSNGYVQLTLPSGYNQVKVNYNNPHVAGTFVRIYIDNILKDTCTAGSSREYIQSYTSGQVLRIEEEGAIIGKNLIITLTNTNYVTNTYTLSVQSGTSIQVNNQPAQYLSGNYTITVGATQSSVVGLSGQTNPFPLANGTTIAIRYSMTRQVPTLDPIGAQWTYSSNNTNVYHLGNVGIGTTSPEYSLDVRGNIYSSSGGYTQSGLTTWSIASDRRIKENIVKASYEKCLENVKNIELYNFNFKDNYVNTNDRRQLGFIAQEVQQVYPKAVEVGKMIIKNNDGIENILSLNTTQIEYTLYGAVKKLIDNIEEMENEIEEIENTSNITTHA